MRYAHLQGTNRGPKRVFYLLVVDENGHARLFLILKSSCGHAHFDELRLRRLQSLLSVTGLRLYDKLPSYSRAILG